MNMIQKNILIKILVTLIFSFSPLNVFADYSGQQVNFFVNPDYDSTGREIISANLKKIGRDAYFYVDNVWWSNLDYQGKEKVKMSLQGLDYVFSQQIRPKLTSVFGFERSPGIDNDKKITILIHPMKKEARGYFNNVDEYLKTQSSRSNQREMVYLNADYITSPISKSLLAHEYTHLITFNQKDKYLTEEETCLNEARAEYAPTLVGFDDDYNGSYLQKRVNDFLSNPSDSITEWKNKPSDYGALNLFTHYLVEQYGVKILSDSLQSKYVGVQSLNKALEDNGIGKDLSDIFTDWTIAAYVNDCSLGEQYCYKNKNLKDVRIIPLINFLPLSGRSTLGVTQETKDWAGNWFKFIGGKGTLRLEFIGETSQSFRVPYIVQELSNKYSLGFFELNNFQRGTVSIPNFGTNVGSITIIPSIQTKLSNFTNNETSFPFFWEASTATAIKDENINYLDKPISSMSKQELLSKENDLKRLLGQLNDQVVTIEREEKEKPIMCGKFKENLYFGLKGDGVRCLQQFLRTQEGIYPEGLVTGNFFTLTSKAVIKFQEKYANDILAPLGLKKGTGFVGSSTRDKLNELLGF